MRALSGRLVRGRSSAPAQAPSRAPFASLPFLACCKLFCFYSWLSAAQGGAEGEKLGFAAGYRGGQAASARRLMLCFYSAAAGASFWSRAFGQPETGGLVRPVCGVSAANRAARSRTKRLLSRHRRRSGDDTARERELRLNTALVESTADQHRAHSQRSVPCFALVRCGARKSAIRRPHLDSHPCIDRRRPPTRCSPSPWSRPRRPPSTTSAPSSTRSRSSATRKPPNAAAFARTNRSRRIRDGHARHVMILAPGGRARRAPGCCLHRRWLLWRPRTRSNLQESLLRPALPRLCRGGPYPRTSTPQILSYDDVLDAFFRMHDATARGFVTPIRVHHLYAQ